MPIHRMDPVTRSIRGHGPPPEKGSSPLQYTPVNCSHASGWRLLVPKIATHWVLLLLICSTSLPADEVQLKNGHMLRGRVVSDDGKQVLLQVPEGSMWIRRSQIETILRLSPEKTLIEECHRRLERGSPGSALPFLRREFHASPHRDEVLVIYRKSLVAEVELLLDREKMDPALSLWNEYCSLPGSTPESLPLRSRILAGEQLLASLEGQIHLSLEANRPHDALVGIGHLLDRFPSEQWKWADVRVDVMVESARRMHDSGDLSAAAPMLMEAVILRPQLITRVRSAMAHCAFRGFGLSLEEALELIPDEPALHLAAAQNARLRGSVLLQSKHLSRVREMVGDEIDPGRIEHQLRQRASQELAGMPSLEPSVQQLLERTNQKLWKQWRLPYSPPARTPFRVHEDVDTMRETLGLDCGPALLITRMQYGRVLSETLHLAPGTPFLDQDALPREMMRRYLPLILGQPRDLPPWLEEGICSISRGSLALARDRMLLSRAKRYKSLPDLSRLTSMQASIDDEVYRAACGSLVAWIIEDVPLIRLPDLFELLATSELEHCLSKVTGADTLLELQQAWIRRLDSGS